jgi:hypothetical protein
LETSAQPRIPDAAVLAESELKRGNTESGLANSKRILTRWALTADAPRLLAVVARYYAVSRISQAQFYESELPWLATLRQAPRLAPAVDEMKRAFDGEFSVTNMQQARELFPFWASAPQFSEPFAKLLISIGHESRERGQSGPALVRYLAAFWIRPVEADAAVEAIAVFREKPGELERNRMAFDMVIDELFVGKGAAYDAGDWSSILRFHVVLGKIFEISGNWGPPGEPRSAIFQWSLALKAEEQVRRQDPRFPPSPAVHYVWPSLIGKGRICRRRWSNSFRLGRILWPSGTGLGRRRHWIPQGASRSNPPLKWNVNSVHWKRRFSTGEY